MFQHLKVLELATVLAGPSVGQFFAELGAEVIKVENPATGGDVTRSWKAAGEQTDDRSAYFCAVNFGKKSIAVKLDTPEGRAIVHQLVRDSDIVIASYKPGDARRLGVDYDTLKTLQPKLIYGQITGYGSHDARVGYDALIQAEAGFMYMNGVPGGESLKMPVALIDVLAGHHLKEGILVAMLRQQKTGQSEFVEVSLIQAAVASLVNQATNWLIAGQVPEKKGSAHPNIAPYGDVFKTADGDEFLLSVGNDRQFTDLCVVLGIPETAHDQRFKTNAARVANRPQLNVILREKIGGQSAVGLLQALQRHKIPGGRISSVQQVFETPEAQQLVLRSIDRLGVKTYAAQPFPEKPSHFLPPPHLGEHTVEILTKLGVKLP
jgi:crotonobetainyl-CoA:carnitine CoA-transferase CaiB-like acyl-CoA transferase